MLSKVLIISFTCTFLRSRVQYAWIVIEHRSTLSHTHTRTGTQVLSQRISWYHYRHHCRLRRHRINTKCDHQLSESTSITTANRCAIQLVQKSRITIFGLSESSVLCETSHGPHADIAHTTNFVYHCSRRFDRIRVRLFEILIVIMSAAVTVMINDGLHAGTRTHTVFSVFVVVGGGSVVFVATKTINNGTTEEKFRNSIDFLLSESPAATAAVHCCACCCWFRLYLLSSV